MVLPPVFGEEPPLDLLPPSARLKLAKRFRQPTNSSLRPARFRRPVLMIAAAVLAAWCFVAADAWIRDGWQRVSLGRHLLAALALYSAFGAAIGLLGVALSFVEDALARWASRRGRRWELGARLGLAFVIGALASVSTAFWTFSGEKAKRSALAGVAPYLFIAALGVAAAAWRYALALGVSAREEQRRGRAALLAAGMAGLGGLLIYLDLHVFVALYARLHTILEVAGALLVSGAIGLGLALAYERRTSARWALTALVVVAGGWAAMVATRGWTRLWIDEALRHVWLEPAYAGRVLQRLQVVEAFLANPVGYEGVQLTRLSQMKERFDITNTALAPQWDQPYREPPELARAIEALRGDPRDYNVLVFYVDTLRADVANDPGIMPQTVAFARTALNFRHAYSTGSDTIRALPGLTGGSYDLAEEHPGDLLQVAGQAQMESVLVIAQSAREFLAKLRPTFQFDQTVVISDYAPEKEVWGYGADGPTSGPIVDRTLHWLRKNRDSRFFLWLFNFDVHAWRELDEAYVRDSARLYGVPDEHALNWRYRVVARALDEQFGRLLRGLDELDLAKKTIVLFVSDHGEALGRDGFWVHSIFLWESLIRVPLILRIPGVPPRVIQQRVSLVDVAPTLARYMLPDPSMKGYHGEDLLGYLVGKSRKRRLPILTQATSQQQLVRIGIVDSQQPWKLVLSFESGLPELYDLRAKDPDAANVSEQHRAQTLELLSTLVRSPVFPRVEEAEGTGGQGSRSVDAARTGRP